MRLAQRLALFSLAAIVVGMNFAMFVTAFPA